MTRAELEEMTKEDLVNYADDRDIEVHQGWLKEEIVAAILKGQKTQAKTAATPAEQPAEPATADELADSAGELVKWMEDAGHRDHAMVVKAKDILERFK